MPSDVIGEVLSHLTIDDMIGLDDTRLYPLIKWNVIFRKEYGDLTYRVLRASHSVLNDRDLLTRFHIGLSLMIDSGMFDEAYFIAQSSVCYYKGEWYQYDVQYDDVGNGLQWNSVPTFSTYTISGHKVSPIPYIARNGVSFNPRRIYPYLALYMSISPRVSIMATRHALTHRMNKDVQLYNDRYIEASSIQHKKLTMVRSCRLKMNLWSLFGWKTRVSVRPNFSQVEMQLDVLHYSLSHVSDEEAWKVSPLFEFTDASYNPFTDTRDEE